MSIVRAALAAMILVVACERLDQPIDPVWGKQACGGCGMIMSERRTAAEVVTRAGDRVFFDDPGCMVVWTSAHGEAAQEWVMNADDGRWTPARLARWRSDGKTPMDFGWEAHGDGLPWETMRASVLARARSSR